MEGTERRIKLYKGYCSFGYNSAIVFCKDNGDELLIIDPNDLSAIYGAYRQMVREKLEDEKLNV